MVHRTTQMHDRWYFQKALVTKGTELAPVQVQWPSHVDSYTGDNDPKFLENI